MTSITATYVGGPTLRLTYAGLTFLTDPTFDEPGSYPGAGADARASSSAPRSPPPSSARSTSCCSRTTSTPTTSTTRAGALLAVGPRRSCRRRTPAARIPGVRGLEPWERQRRARRATSR